MNISGRFLLLRTKKTTSLPLQRSSCVSKFKHHSLVSSMAASTAAAAEKRATLYSLNFQLAADGIDSTAKKIMDNHRQGMDSIVQMSSTKFEDSFRAFALCEAKAVISSSQVTLPALTSTDSAAREARRCLACPHPSLRGTVRSDATRRSRGRRDAVAT